MIPPSNWDQVRLQQPWLRAAICGMLCGLAACAAKDGMQNLLCNPGFEQVGASGKAPPHWHVADWNAKDQRAPIAAHLDTENPAEGNAAARMEHQGDGGNLVLYQDLKIPSPGDYRLSLRCRTTGEASAWASAVTLTGGKTGLYESSPKVSSGGAWKQIVLAFAVEEPADMLRIILRATATGVLFDDVVLNGPAPGNSEPSTGAQLSAARKPRGPYDKEADERRKAAMTADERAWESLLEQNLGAFYLPLYKKAKLAGRETAWDYVRDDPGLPRILLIGDSISRGYTVPVRHALKDRANVHRAPANCGPTASGLKKLDVWLGSKGWDLIHFNFGIHDRNTDPDIYAQRLTEIVKKLQATGATLVWASSTPLSGKMLDKDRNDPMVGLNRVAAQIMMEHRVRVNDLHSTAQPLLRTMQGKDGCHFNGEGYKVLGKAVAEAISRMLGQ